MVLDLLHVRWANCRLHSLLRLHVPFRKRSPHESFCSLISDSLQSRVLARVEAIVTQLVFEHALRMRTKAEVTADSAPQSKVTTAATTPDSASVAESSTTAQDNGSAGGASSTGKGKQKDSEQATAVSQAAGKDGKQKQQEDKSKNVAGKINNLISSDLASIGMGREFLILRAWDHVALRYFFELTDTAQLSNCQLRLCSACGSSMWCWDGGK